MNIVHMRTDHLTNPLGFRLEKPGFSWAVEGAKGKKQQSARVEVSLREDFSKLLYDSGESDAISSLRFEPDIALKPRTRYHWRVTVTSDIGEEASGTAWFETGKRGEKWTGKWIKAPYDKDVHPRLGTSFELASPVRSARLYATALGIYEAYVNGVKAGDEVLAPFFNDYDSWVQVQAYDVTGLLKQGVNTLEAMLGNGWYKGKFGFTDGTKEVYGDRTQFIGELHMVLEDGSEVIVATGDSWLCAPSPVLDSNIYDGEIYDANLEGSALKDPAVPAAKPAGKLTDRLSPPVRIIERLENPALLNTPAGETVLDFGQVLTGWLEFDCALPKGQEIFLQFGELLQHDNFYNENLRSAKQEYRYISSGKPARVRPHFTFYGFRYVKVTGPAQVDPAAFTACVIHSDLDEIGAIETSNPKVNQLISNARWSQKGNFLDVPTDCPQRDERMGWTGDAQVFAPTASYNMHTPAFFEKYLYDMLMEQRKLGGAVPHVVPDVLGRIQQNAGNHDAKPYGACAWADAATTIPWTVYRFFGDKRLLENQFENMTGWVDWIKRQDDELCGGARLWKTGFHFADWLALDNPIEGSPLGGTDPYYIASAYYYYSARLTAQAARVLGKKKEEKYYADLASQVRSAFRKEFFSVTGRITEPTQTAMAIALHLDLVPPRHRARLRQDLMKRLEKRKMHLETGFVGTYFLPGTLSDNDMNQAAYTLLLNEDYPSWLYEVNMGATTIWERWNSVLPNGLVSDTGMNSMNHYAYGSIVEWMYRNMVGLNPVDSTPGFKRALIRPRPDPRIGHVSATYDSAAGRYAVAWKQDDSTITFKLTVPFDAEADFVSPDTHAKLTVNGRNMRADRAVRLAAGDHLIVMTKTNDRTA